MGLDGPEMKSCDHDETRRGPHDPFAAVFAARSLPRPWSRTDDSDKHPCTAYQQFYRCHSSSIVDLRRCRRVDDRPPDHSQAQSHVNADLQGANEICRNYLERLENAIRSTRRA